MRYSLFLITGSLLLIFVSCEDGGTQPTASFDSMLFERAGAAQITFTVSPSVSPTTVEILISRLDNRDTVKTASIQASDPDDTTFSAYFEAIRGQCAITGDFKQSLAPAGTWVTQYMVKGASKQEITNTALRTTLMRFEQLVRITLQ